MQKFLFILFGVCISGISFANVTGYSKRVPCGSWYEISCMPYTDYHFVRWSDGNTEATRQIQVNDNSTYFAIIAPNCEEYANWPIATLYDWLIVLNVRAINEMGYYFRPEQVSWYRIVGSPDDMHSIFPQDDQLVCTGIYLNMDRNLWGTGDYYAVVDASDNHGLLCDGMMRSEIVQFAGSKSRSQISLKPNYVQPSQEITICGLNPTEDTMIAVYAASGQLVTSFVSSGEAEIQFSSPIMHGCYQVKIVSRTVNNVERFIVY